LVRAIRVLGYADEFGADDFFKRYAPHSLKPLTLAGIPPDAHPLLV